MDRFLRGPANVLIARPWFDPVALWCLGRLFIPMARAWAAATVAGGSLERFLAELPANRLPRALEPGLRSALQAVAQLKRELDAAEGAWDAAFFGTVAPAPTVVAATDRHRRRASHALMSSRLLFRRLALRQRLPLVRFDVPDPAAAEARYGALPDDPRHFHALPATLPAVEESRRVNGPRGPEYWLRFASPNPFMPGLAWAHVFEPADAGPSTPTYIDVHGVCIEADSFNGGFDDLQNLVARGVRLVRLSAPWHDRRRLPGRYGGEPFFASQPVSGLDLFRSLVLELAVLTGWARGKGGGRVAIGGTSLGALATQLAASHATGWPQPLRPDALFLTTTSADMTELCFHSALSRMLGIGAAMMAAGWTRERVRRWSHLAEPLAEVAVAPEDIVMVLGLRDTVTAYPSGLALARAWHVPAQNLFKRRQGHFSVPLGMLRDRSAYERLLQRLFAG
jgi:hypothetical protein